MILQKFDYEDYVYYLSGWNTFWYKREIRMYGREKLKIYWGGATNDCDVYNKAEADKVMNAMENRIKKLEKENEKLKRPI